MKAAPSETRRKAWETRRAKYGPRGHKPVQPWRRKPGARAKSVAAQSDAANVTRETPGAPFSPSNGGPMEEVQMPE